VETYSECPFCHILFPVDEDEDVEFFGVYGMCQSASEAGFCQHHPSRRSRAKLEVVGSDFERIEDNPVRLEAMQYLIDDGGAWLPGIDADGHVGRQANDLIARGLCKPPTDYEAQRSRQFFDGVLRSGSMKEFKAS
jgi:hypothetical protein